MLTPTDLRKDSMKRALTLILLIPLLGCTPSSPTASPAPAASVAVTSDPSPSPSEEHCYNADHQDVLRGLGDIWTTIVTSRGESDQPELVQEMYDVSNDFADTLDEVCDDEIDLAASYFVYEVALLNASVHIEGDAKNSAYQKVADAGGKLSGSIRANASFAAPDPDDEPFTPRRKDFLVGIKTLKKSCFGSAGCNVTFRIDPEYVGSQDIPDEGTIEVTYRVVGGEDPLENTFTVKRGSASFDNQEFIQTRSSGSKLRGKVLAVSYDE
jgi:hypothetical protein